MTNRIIRVRHPIENCEPGCNGHVLQFDEAEQKEAAVLFAKKMVFSIAVVSYWFGR